MTDNEFIDVELSINELMSINGGDFPTRGAHPNPPWEDSGFNPAAVGMMFNTMRHWGGMYKHISDAMRWAAANLEQCDDITWKEDC